jgi:hypothetical protein
MNKLLLILFSTCVLHGCKNVPLKKDKAAGDSSRSSARGIVHAISGPGGYREFTIDAPDGWTKTDTVLFDTNITLIKSPEEKNDDFIENVNVVSEKAGGYSLDVYYEKSVEMMKAQLHDFREGQQADKTINGIEFKNLKYSHNYNGRRLDVDVYFAISGQTGYVITCTTSVGNISKWQADFDKIIHSFSFN